MKQPKKRQPRGINAPPRPLECPFCDHEEKSKMALGFHLMKDHPVFIPGVSKPKCDSCGERVDYTQTLYKRNEEYDSGYAPGIGNTCGCVKRFQKAGYQTLPEVVGDRERLIRSAAFYRSCALSGETISEETDEQMRPV